MIPTIILFQIFIYLYNDRYGHRIDDYRFAKTEKSKKGHTNAIEKAKGEEFAIKFEDTQNALFQLKKKKKKKKKYIMFFSLTSLLDMKIGYQENDSKM